MTLKDELKLNRGFTHRAHEALLNIYYTGTQIKKRSRDFFKNYGITDVQFNVLELLLYQSEEKTGLTQAELSDMMLVNRANTTTLIDRMERDGLVARTPIPGDRRYNAIRMTGRGKKIVLDIEEQYDAEIESIMAVLSEEEQKQLIELLSRIRKGL